METHVLKGSKQEIVDSLIQIVGEVRAAIVFVEEPVAAVTAARPDVDEDIFSGMIPFMVDVPEVDDSREAIYSRMEIE
ncbi:MAG TPA: hypothetical protein VF278_12065 [Pirellulales bacterium]